jgi:DNA-binding helix-hairpin-helix protein with protein kinase domain
LQGSRFDRTKRTPNHDNFGLGVLVFQLLFMGRHPFSGKYLGSGEMPLERAISEYRFAYSMQTATNMQRPPGAPLLSDFPPFIAEAFEKAFGRAGLQKRPGATDWISLLEKLEGELQQCSADKSHHHVKGRPCPWCRMEQANPGFIAFISGQPTTFIPTVIDVGQITAIINAIRDPGPTPNIQTIIVSPTNLNAASPAASLTSKLQTRAYGGVAAAAFGTVLIFFGGGAVVPGFFVLGAGVLCNVLVPPELKNIRNIRSQASASWRLVQNGWSQQPGNKKFLEVKQETNDLVRALADLPNEEKRGIQILEQKKKEAQLYRHLDRYLIAHAKIKKIGSARKAVLASFGIETAADIDPYKISGIQGFGPGLVAELVAWKQTQANKFLFNPNEPINPADLAALRAKIKASKADTENKIRTSTTSLQQLSNFSLEQRRKITSSANQAYAAFKQAELDEAAVEGPLQKATKFISFFCVVFAVVGLARMSEPPNQSGNVTPPVTKVSPAPTVVPPQKPTAPWPADPVPTKPSVPPTIQRLPGSQSAGVDDKQIRPAPNSGTNAAPTVPPLSGTTPPVSGVPQPAPSSPATQSPPLPPPQEISPVPGRTAEPSNANDLARLDLSRSEDAVRVQQRLIALGYLSGTADGKWGPRSKAALTAFKTQQNLPALDSWDDLTQTAMFSANAAPYVNVPLSNGPLFVGGWTNVNGQCGDPGDPPPLRITTTRAETDGGLCEFKSVRPDGQNVWRVLAVCSSRGQSWQANVKLTVNGSKLRWVSERPEAVYFRCQDSP